MIWCSGFQSGLQSLTAVVLYNDLALLGDMFYTPPQIDMSFALINIYFLCTRVTQVSTLLPNEVPGLETPMMAP